MSYFSMPSHVIIGNDTLIEAKIYLKRLGNKALIVTGRHVGKSPMMNKLQKVLSEEKITWYMFDKIIGEPTDSMINEGVEIYKKNDCEFCIGIGGGSAIDSAKAIALLSVNGGKVSKYYGKEIKATVPPIVAIPTTSGTGSEATKFSVVTDKEKNIKILLKGNCLIPQVAIIDYDFTVDMPKSITASTGLVALTHAIEAFTSKKAFQLTDVYAVSAVKRIIKYLPIAYINGYNVKAREQLAIAAFEAGVCINNSSVTIAHGMSRQIEILFNVPHGISNAMLLKECIKFSLDCAYDRFGKLGREIGIAGRYDADKEAAEKLLIEIDEICKICKVPTLKEYGVKEDMFIKYIPKMAEDALHSEGIANMRKVISKEDCMKIYKKVYLA